MHTSHASLDHAGQGRACPPLRITFTGADDNTSIDAMISLAAAYPGQIEWGILFSKSRQGLPRYPSKDWLRELLLAPGLLLSAHLCGEYARNVLGRGNTDIDQLLAGHFERAQVNTADPVNPRSVAAWAGTVGVSPILQCRGGFPMDDHVQWLFDESGGTGVAARQWPHPCQYPERRTWAQARGYAGGLGPANVAAAVARIGATPHDYWIDMESGVRDSGNTFDLRRCAAVCDAVFGPSTVPSTLAELAL